MKKTKLTVFTLTLVFSILLSGCVSTVALTENEGSIIADYSSYVMIKHSKFQNSALTGRNELKTLIDNEKSSQDSSVKDADKEKEIADSENNDNLNEKTNKNLPGENNSSESKSSDSKTSNSKTSETKTYTDHSQALRLNGLSLEYCGYDVRDVYMLDYFALNSTSGNDLAILKFKLKNNSQEAINCDIMSLAPSYTLTINESSTVSAESTVLVNDLSTLKKTIDPGSEQEVVLIFEGPEKVLASIQMLSLSVSISGQIYNIAL